ncbi:hypothetical protein [Actinacidiphila epipremni]|uniref:Uncharacterized protein n=1 Tax=Actinacidiphila epipremni TaxID=2053013 RepID=A0ABX0ZIM2_9ACTN|nr:hypothetical protein [Actinacidiphila epipremni]NJP42297.1 hypothetical protein [Actinacidiphila epipremni]
MLTIPTDLDRWHPNDVTAWLRDIEDDPTVTDAEFDQAQAAVDEALLGTTAQA